MKITEIYELMDRFESSCLTELEIEEEGKRVRLKKDADLKQSQCRTSQQDMSIAQTAQVSDKNMEKICAPLVGIFYKAPSPDEPDFTAVGEKVTKGQTLCIIEAMKVMNELKSPIDGTVRAIHGVNGQLAEYGQVLFEVEKC